MELYQLKYFMETAKTGSMTKAAKNLFVSQPAISQALSKLENELGASLFDRSDKSFRITDTGKLLYIYTERILYELDSFYEEYDTGMKKKGLMLISADECFEQYLLPSFIMSHPDVKVSTQIVSKDMISKMLQGVNVDIAVTNEDLTDSKFHSKYVMDAEAFVLVPRSSPLSKKTTVRLSELSGEPFVLLKSEDAYQKNFNETVARTVPNFNLLYEGNEASWSNMQLNRNCFLFTNSYRLMKNDIYPYHKIVKLEEKFLNQRVYVTCKRKSVNPNVRIFMENLNEMFHEVISNSFYTKNGLLHTMANAKQLDSHDE